MENVLYSFINLFIYLCINRSLDTIVCVVTLNVVVVVVVVVVIVVVVFVVVADTDAI